MYFDAKVCDLLKVLEFSQPGKLKINSSMNFHSKGTIFVNSLKRGKN